MQNKSILKWGGQIFAAPEQKTVRLHAGKANFWVNEIHELGLCRDPKFEAGPEKLLRGLPNFRIIDKWRLEDLQLEELSL